MAMQKRTSGVWIEARGTAAVATGAPPIRRARLNELRPPAPGGAGRRRGAAPAQAPLTEEEAVVNVLEAQDLDLVDAIPIAPGAAPAAAAARRAAPGAPPAPAAEVELAVPAAAHESAVVLVDQGGFYQWQWPEREREATSEEAAALPPRRRGPAAAAAAPAAPAKALVFRIALAPAAAPPAGAAQAMRRGGLLTQVATSQAMVYVFRFIVAPVLTGAARFLERKVAEGLVRIAAPDPQSWQYVGDEAGLPLPAGRPARVLLLVHGTFSSTVGSFGALAGQPEGQAFLQAALAYYDLVLGYDHPTLSVLPSENAGELAKRLERIPFAEAPEVDAISYSRGGLVLRSLVESILPTAPLALRLRRAIFVGATNGGTELANPANWKRLADRYTNLAAAGARAAALIPGFAATGVILASAIRGVGVLVKVLAASAVTDQAVPGLAAMEPGGPFVREINGRQPGQPAPEQTDYRAITSDFDPDAARASADPSVLPPGLLLQLADKGADALYGKPNDLVVNVDSMTDIDPSVGDFVRGVFPFGTNGKVHHCAYFSQPETARHLMQWLLPVAGAPALRMLPAALDGPTVLPTAPPPRRGTKAKPPEHLGQRAKPPAPPEVECHFRAETDDEVEVGRVHTVDVTLSREQLAAALRPVHGETTVAVKESRPLVVECLPMLRVVLCNPDDARVEIPVPAPGQPATLRFDLRGNEAGPGQVRVQVRQGPLPLANLVLDFAVVAERSRARQPATAQAELAALPERIPDAVDELRIWQLQPAGQKTQYRFELRLPSRGVQQAFESPLLDAEPAAYVGSIHKRIEDRWAEHASEKEAFARDLRAIGAELFDELLPRELQELLWQHRQAVASVQVLSSEPFIPWELVLLHDPAQRKPGADAAFLGELGVVRWLVFGYPPEALRLRPGMARYVIPAYPPPDTLPAAQQEIDLVQARFAASAVQPQAEAVYELLERPGGFDLLHIACHGAADAADIGSARLVMPGKPRSDGSLSEESVLATTVRHDADLRDGDARPMVVLNACQSARAGYTLKGLGGFAEAFIEAGAGVFVGSSWSVGDAPALAFVQEFYARLVEGGDSLSAAAAAARRKARDDGDATWLAYAVYGHPRAHVARG